MASITGRGAKGHHTYKLTLTEKSTSTEKNESYVDYSFDLIDDANWYWEQWGNSISYSISANGSVIKSGSIPNHTTKNQNIAIGSFTVPHNADGTKSISYSFSVTDGAGKSYTSGNASASGTMTLTTIARYANLISLTVKSKTETSITLSYTTDNPAWLFAKINGGEWLNCGNAFVNNTTSGEFTIYYKDRGNTQRLDPNTTYNITVLCRALNHNSGIDTFKDISATTYNYPHCTNSPDFVIGDTLTLNFYNPLSRSVTVTIIGNDGSAVDVFNNLTGTELSGYNAQNTIDNLYKSIPNNQSGRYKVIVSYGNVATTRDAGNIYKIRGNEIPSINEVVYFTSDTKITGNPQHIVQNISPLNVIFNDATPNYWAGSIVQYYIECNGKTAQGSQANKTYELGTIDSERDVDLTLTAVDSRGLSASATIKVIMLAHSDPTALVTLQRLNNYEDTTYLTVDGSVSSVNNLNTMDIQYRYKLSGGSYGSPISIGDRETQTLTLDKNSVFIFEVTVTDAFGSKFIKEYTLNKGVFPLFIDTRLNSVGINKLPKYNKSLETWGLISLGERETFEIEAGDSIEIPIFLSLCSGLVNFRMSGANLEVARLFYVFRSNQYFGLHKTLIDESYGNTSAVVPMEMRNAEQGYIFKITNNHSSTIHIRYGILELC